MVTLSLYRKQPLTEQDKENREACVRDTSGKMVVTQVFCPNCKRLSRFPVEKEHVENLLAWRVNNMIVIKCECCNKK